MILKQPGFVEGALQQNSYDANGNMYSGGGRTVTYTAANLTASVTPTGGSGAITYEYDASDQRYNQSAPEGTTTYWNAQGVTSEQFTATGSSATLWKNYIVAGGETIGVAQGSTAGASLWGSPSQWGTMVWSTVPLSAQYFHSDHLGSVVAVTYSGGAVLERDSYDAWGKRRQTTGADDPGDTISPSQVNRGYTTQEQVSDIAWVNLNARMYDPQIGKFMATDPMVGEPFSSQGWNRYAYVGNNPLRNTDPTGENYNPETGQSGECYGNCAGTGWGGGMTGMGGGGTQFNVYVGGNFVGVATAQQLEAAGFTLPTGDELAAAGNNAQFAIGLAWVQSSASTSPAGGNKQIVTAEDGGSAKPSFKRTGVENNYDKSIETAWSDHMLSDGTKLNYDTKTNEEQGIGISQQGTYSNPFKQICWTCDDGRSGIGGQYNLSGLREASDLPGHTHPLGTDGRIDPLPGPGDGALAVTKGTSYVVSRLGVFAVEHSAITGFSVRQVAGPRLEQDDKADIHGVIANWGRNGGGLGPQCSIHSCVP